MTSHTYRIIIEPDERKTFHAYVPTLPGCHTWGRSLAETRKNIRDAVEVYLRSLIADGEKVPEDIGIEVMETFSAPSYRRRSLTHAQTVSA